jgi:hypothetical protein
LALQYMALCVDSWKCIGQTQPSISLLCSKSEMSS